MPTEPTPHRSDEELLALVREKATGLRRQRGLRALGAVTLAVLVVAGGIAVAGQGGDTRHTIRTAGEAPSTTTEEPTTSSTEPVTTSTTQSGVVTPVTTPATTTTTKRPAPLTAAFTASPQVGPTATLVRFSLHVTDGRGSWNAYMVDFGDGSSGAGWGVAASCAPPVPGQPEGPPPTTDSTKEFFHGFRHPGTYQAKAHVETSTSCSQDAAPESQDVTVSITVLPGAEPSNGPVQPTAFVYQSWPTDRDPALTYVSRSGGDDDGFVSRLSVDWGDGSQPAVTDYPLSDCHDPGSTWPKSSTPPLPDAGHKYAAPGKYTARLTVTSVGCDGRDAQTATAETQVSYPSTPPSG